MAVRRLTLRIDEAAFDGLAEICDAWRVSQTALVQALLEVSVQVYRAGGDENRAPVYDRAVAIDTERRRRLRR